MMETDREEKERKWQAVLEHQREVLRQRAVIQRKRENLRQRRRYARDSEYRQRMIGHGWKWRGGHRVEIRTHNERCRRDEKERMLSSVWEALIATGCGAALGRLTSGCDLNDVGLAAARLLGAGLSPHHLFVLLREVRRSHEQTPGAWCALCAAIGAQRLRGDVKKVAGLGRSHMRRVWQRCRGRIALEVE